MLSSLLLAVLLLATCGRGASNRPPRLVLWYEAGVPFATLVPKLVAQYNATKPTVPVLAQEQVQLSLKLPVVIGAHDAPDLVIYQRSQAWPLASRGAAFPFTDYARRDGVTGSGFDPIIWSGAHDGQELWGMPITVDATVLMYNKKMFAAAGLDPSHAPTTWDEVIADCKKLSVLRGGRLAQTGFFANRDVPFSTWLWMAGGALLTPNGKAAAFDSPAGKQTIQFLIATIAADGGADGMAQLQLTQAFSGGEEGLFRKGKLAMEAGTSTTISLMSRSAVGPDLGTGPLPHPTTGKSLTVADGYYIFSPKNAPDPHPDGAWQFMRWLSTNQQAQLALAAANVVPALTSAEQDPTVASGPGVATILSAIHTARYASNHPGEREVEATVDQDVGQAVAGRMTADQALAAAAKRTVTILHLYQAP